jgi:hypothetical protein
MSLRLAWQQLGGPTVSIALAQRVRNGDSRSACLDVL